MNYILFGDHARDHLLPFTFIRPLADIRIGTLTIREKWEHLLKARTSSLTVDYLNVKYPLVKEDDNILINSSIFPSTQVISDIQRLLPNQTLVSGDTLIAHRLRAEDIDNLDAELLEKEPPVEAEYPINRVSCLYDMISYNRRELFSDFNLLTSGRESQSIPPHIKVSNPGKVFVEEGAILESVVINADEGPVYIGKDTHLMDGAVIRGPVSIGEGSVVRIAAKIYGNTSIGPFCKVGGEVTDSIMFGYSNKPNEGFLAYSVIGEWCNLAALTTTSDLRIDYDDIRLWDYAVNSFVVTGSQFCGTFMGDHSKTGISTMLNTGTVIGVNAQVFGARFMRNFIPSFTRSSQTGHTFIHIEKAIEIARRVYERRNKIFDRNEEDILRHVFGQTLTYRKI